MSKNISSVKKIVQKILFLTLHVSFFLLVIVIIISFITIHSLTLKLPVNISLPFVKIASALKIKSLDKYYGIALIVKSFEKNTIKKNNRTLLTYSSHIIIRENSDDLQRVIKVNKPLLYKRIKFHQQDWSFVLYDFAFSFNGKQYDLKIDREKEITIDNNHSFVFFPIDLQGNKIVYQWNIVDKTQKITKKGYFTKSSLTKENYLVKTFNFKILKDEIYPVTILQVSYKPYNLLLLITAIFFVISLIIYFLFVKFLKQKSQRQR